MEILTPDEATVSIIRTLIPDKEQVFEGDYLFSIEDIADFYTVAGGSALRAAAFAKIAIGDSEALISKVIKTQDLSTNGAQVAEAFRKSAETLLKRADEEDFVKNGFYSNIVDLNNWELSRPELTEWNWGV